MLQRPSIQALFDGYQYFPMGGGQAIIIPQQQALASNGAQISKEKQRQKKISVSMLKPEKKPS